MLSVSYNICKIAKTIHLLWLFARTRSLLKKHLFVDQENKEEEETISPIH